MATNIIGNNNNTNSSSNNNPYIHTQQMVSPQQLPNVIVTTNNPGNSLRDVFLQPHELSSGGCPYDHIIEMIRGLDLQDDGIVMNHKIKSIEMDFCNIVRDENMLCESMEYINEKVLSDGDTSLKFALLFSSRNFDALAMNETKVRSAMLKILETNFLNADNYRLHNKERLYNSITLLGEYYHRVRLADNSPITILGESLLGLLIREVSEVVIFDVKLAKLVLSQITLNGDIMRAKHKAELTQLLYHIRRNLIEQPSLKPAVKALLLMTLDLYYSNFANLGAQLEEMYTKYLVQDDEDEGNNNLLQDPLIAQHPLSQQQQQIIYQQHLQPQPPTHVIQPIQQQITQQIPVKIQEPNHDDAALEKSFANINGGSGSSAGDDSFEKPAKKWSEQVCEESFYENEFGNELNCDNNTDGIPGGDGGYQGRHNKSYGEQGNQLLASSSRYENEHDSSNRNSRRLYTNQQRNSPRPLKHNTNTNNNDDQHQQQTGEELDQSKPLPRWRAPRFNRDNSDQQNDHRGGGHRNQQRRYSASFEDDRQSVRSEGGSIRLYSINDRLKHSQEKMERSNGSQYNSLANSNWDRQSQRDDRSERSYISNYERGNNNHRRGGRNYNNRQMYDKPPRFQKNQRQNNSNNKDNEHHIRSDTWRRSNNNMTNSYQDENSSYPSNGPESNSRSSSRARTLPRPSKSNLDDAGNPNSPTYRRSSQSPTHYGNQYHRGGSSGGGAGGSGANSRIRGGGRNYNARYSSQSSLASEASTNNLDRRHNRQNRNFERRSQQQQQQPPQQENWEDTHSLHGQPEESTWDAKDNNSELVRNARNTTKYMNYLSSKK